MEHVLVEVQLCIKISIFKETHVFDILDHPTFSWKPELNSLLVLHMSEAPIISARFFLLSEAPIISARFLLLWMHTVVH